MAKKGMNNKGKMSVKEAGKRGGMATSRRHGPEFYHQIGTKGGETVRRLIQKGKNREKSENMSNMDFEDM
ncbi:MAG: Em GEA1 (EM1) [Patescibacteria group bacterium]|jgi:hypothetical protein